MDNVANINTSMTPDLKSTVPTVIKKSPTFISRNHSERKYPLPTAIGGMTNEELSAEIMKGLKAIEDGKVRPADEVEAEIAREFGF